MMILGRTVLMHMTAMCIAVGLVWSMAGSSACGKTPPNLSPEGKAAYFGERFMAGIERAQSETIAYAGADPVKRAEVRPAVEIFVKIGQGGQRFAEALTVIDKSQVTDDKVAAAVRVNQSVTEFQGYLNDLLVKIGTETARERISKIIAGVGLSVMLFDIIKSIAPLLPPKTDSDNAPNALRLSNAH